MSRNISLTLPDDSAIEVRRAYESCSVLAGCGDVRIRIDVRPSGDGQWYYERSDMFARNISGEQSPLFDSYKACRAAAEQEARKIIRREIAVAQASAAVTA